jgi:hypothetical protein
MSLFSNSSVQVLDIPDASGTIINSDEAVLVSDRGYILVRIDADLDLEQDSIPTWEWMLAASWLSPPCISNSHNCTTEPILLDSPSDGQMLQLLDTYHIEPKRTETISDSNLAASSWWASQRHPVLQQGGYFSTYLDVGVDPLLQSSSSSGPSAPTSLLPDRAFHSSTSPPPGSSGSEVRRRTSSLSDQVEVDGSEDLEEEENRYAYRSGMRVTAYRALSAKERKKISNKFAARALRAKKKGKCRDGNDSADDVEYLTSLESTMSVKEKQFRMALAETARLRREIAQLKARLLMYEL